LFNSETTKNHILSNLTTDEAQRIGPHLEQIEAKLGDVLVNSGDTIDFLFFPDGSMASIVGVTARGGSAEIGIVGKEGLIGAEVFLGAERMPNHVSIQMPDGGFKLPAAIALREFEMGGSFQKNVLKFFYKLLVQVSQTAVCNALHSLEQRVARWMLMCHDRSPDDKIRLTQEFLALMVGSTRPSVSLVASNLQDSGVITYTRGVITIIERERLEGFACDCYKVMREAQNL
jgi:CRP-like cAMP-binding protein